MREARVNWSIKRQAAGFTLIEMMVTIAVTAILLSLAMPSFQTMIERNRVESVVNAFSNSLLHARSEAATRNKRVVVCNTANTQNSLPTCTTGRAVWRTVWMTFIDENGDSQLNGNDTLLKIGQPVPVGYVIRQADNIQWLAFSADGGARLQQGQISADFIVRPPGAINNPNSRQLTVDPVGGIRITDR